MAKGRRPGQRQAAPPTPAQMATYGHIAARIRAFMAQHDLKAGDMNERIGHKRENTAIYMWLNARSAPGPMIAGKLAQVMGISPDELLRAGATPHLPVPARAVVTTAPRPTDVLSFNVQSDGDARIKLDITLPIQQATPLLRMLLDHGLIMGTSSTSS